MIILICVLFVVVIILTAKILTMDAHIFELEKAVQVTTPLSDKEGEGAEMKDYGTPEYWSALKKEMESKPKELQSFIRDHRKGAEMTDYRTHEVAQYWTGKLYEAVNCLRMIVSHPCSTQLEASAMKQLAINFLKSNGYMKPSEENDVDSKNSK